MAFTIFSAWSNLNAAFCNAPLTVSNCKNMSVGSLNRKYMSHFNSVLENPPVLHQRRSILLMLGHEGTWSGGCNSEQPTLQSGANLDVLGAHNKVYHAQEISTHFLTCVLQRQLKHVSQTVCAQCSRLFFLYKLLQPPPPPPAFPCSWCRGAYASFALEISGDKSWG